MTETQLAPTDIQETDNTAHVSWKQAKENLPLFLGPYIGSTIAQELYDLGHTGRGFDDFNIDLNFVDQQIELQQLFEKLANSIELYILKKIDQEYVIPEVREFFTTALRADHTTPESQSSDYFYSELKTKYASDQNMRHNIAKMKINKIPILFKYVNVVWMLRHPSIPPQGSMGIDELQKKSLD